jgi:hypothetical protein
MRPVLAYQLDVAAGGGNPAISGELLRLVSDWVRDWYQRKQVSLPDSLGAGSWNAPLPGHAVRTTLATITELQGNWELLWEYPSEDDSALLWRTEVRISWDPDGTDIGILLSVASQEFTVRPFRYDVYAPKALSKITQTFECTVGGRRVDAQPRQLTFQGVQAFVEQTLLGRNRRLPVVLVSRVHNNDQFLVDPNAVAAQFRGLGEVWAMNDKWTAFALTRVLGARHSCFDGAVRIYWPGFETNSRPYDHPLILRRSIEAGRLRGDTPERTLFRLVAPVAGLRYTESRRYVSNRAQHAIAERARQEASIVKATREELESKAFEQIDKVYGLEDKVAALAEENRDLKDKLAALNLSFRQMQGPSLAGRADGPVAVVDRGPPSSVREALDWATEDLSVLLPWDSAYESADRSDYGRPEEVLRALTTISDVAAKYFAQQRTGEAIGRLEKLFESEGFKYAPMDSQTTTTKYGKDRTFSQDGEKVMFKRHLTLGGGDRKNCLQIYFEFEESAGYVNIAYCGVHLPYDGMRS